ncbi:hypothetical protein QQ045_011510 [Rhodiola kirilowii]
MASSSRFPINLKPRFSQYNSFHAAPPNQQIAPYDRPPYHTPWVHYYPPLYIPTTDDPRYPDGRQYVQIRRVGRKNFAFERLRIDQIIKNTEFRYVTIDTEYPGTVHTSKDFGDQNPEGQYKLMKANVDEMSLIQIGLTLSDGDGNLATWGPSNQVIIWEFVISDFDSASQPYNRASMTMLYNRGLDFNFHRHQGISSLEFAQMLRDTGLIYEHSVENIKKDRPKGKKITEEDHHKEISWITFHGAYDFGYLIKALTESELPETLPEFINLVQKYFGKKIYDVKFMLKLFQKPGDWERNNKLMGGLEEVAVKTGVRRILGIGHQSGPDSLLTLLVFKQLKELYDRKDQIVETSAGYIHPLAS